MILNEMRSVESLVATTQVSHRPILRQNFTTLSQAGEVTKLDIFDSLQRACLIFGND